MGLGKRRPPRRASGGSGLSGQQARERQAAPSQAAKGMAHQELAQEGLVDVHGLAHDGRGIARGADGKTVFIDAALPGERVEVAVHLTRKRFDEAHVRQLIDPSPDRVTPPCPYNDRCGGCDLQHLSRSGQRRHKAAVLSDLLARQGIQAEIDSIEVLATDTEGYRRRARLGVRVDAEGVVHMGFRARRSHRLVSVTSCTVLVPELAALLPALHQQLSALASPRLVGHVELLASDDQVTLVVRQLREHAQDLDLWQQWAEHHGVALALLSGRQSPAFAWVIEPRAALTVQVPSAHGSMALGIAPGDFLQANDEVNRLMVATALAWLGAPGTPDEPLLDLFAGIGNFSLPLAAAGYQVAAWEGAAQMVERLRDNAQRVGVDVAADQANLHDQTQVERLLQDPSIGVVVLDPPRDGAEALCRALAKSTVPRVLYIACDPSTLSRDTAHLLQGGYRLRRVAMADMFVHTSHLESMVLLERPTSSPRQGVRRDG
ncbi:MULTISPECIES: 23S rRNA (uracil(1939)-C(5))-methyltransferase RlmD [Halomonas]|uniref:23S rRNA (uracil(1939)-C(5))-methyltransferase RlmD n=1 Tax=Halomonas TaxID=2745 RepID=UPI001C94E5C4|nr:MULTISPECIES: 23S rRNA (uracil(1939)-C(5))-methyltransferase RlmD [Halomonas]MBY5925522.1 23S rRNA (uracil(1939)-C(5))-methyltransferase RlmD [Halomonas sp. DP4Y7-2]MBY6208125.1 23S rRNA (uracil(1939)-C(5))-methyltransferase RlmD [Halomonas sp. DP3Y7-2]MBY6228934.1 23S rRNA (uracil(1939)-C(5))-methyltransferase RlmD [Halomonas sp. DP3Y7-1]MBY6232659.1 23S rRNA (uracil(1939)-C(5))-methyltransferase RlmD [Halomonas sp. DP4Y7-1]MCA0917082.1 23S rRNA (uracil(1939)-C(5))-methyltransferase RlmD [